MRDLPTGTVTFLFTDIEGSTRLLGQLGDRYPEVLEAHQRLVRGALGPAGGVEVSTEGDSFFWVFPAAPAAVAGAVETQRALTGHPWPEDGVVRVRIGIHTGEGTLGADNYVGLDLHRGARIAASGHGGQVLVSEATRALVEQALPEGVTLRDLGEHRLKDLAHPERVYQVAGAGLSADFPPVRSMDARTGNLPTQLTSFVGRERELEEVKDILRATRLLTLTGPGGTGKTRLSLQVAGEAQEGFADGAFFVALAPITDPKLVPTTIGQVLGLREDPTRPALDTVIEHLRDKEMLLVLDNFEQIVEAGSYVAEILGSTEGVKVLVSSREALNLHGEQEYPVPPLGLPDVAHLPPLEALSQFAAVRLFVQRAGAVKPGFAVTNENAPAVAEICTRLDGLPLAIELAAARVKLLSAEQILKRLESRLSLLSGGGRDLPTRQQTLRDAIGWSFDLLESEERRLFARLSVFVGGFTLEAAEAVCAPGLNIDLFEGLASLVNKSLLRQVDTGSGDARFFLLQTIAEFAMEQLHEAEDVDEVRGRHAAFFLDLAERAGPELLGPDQAMWLDTLAEEHDNLRAAITWTSAANRPETALRLGAALWRFWQMRGHLREAAERFGALLALPGAEDHPAARAAALEGAGGVFYWMGQWEPAEAFYAECLELRRSLPDRAALAEAIYNLSFIYTVSPPPKRDLPRGRVLLEETLEIFRELDDRSGLAKVLWGLANIHLVSSDWPPALETSVEALALFRELDDRFGMGWALNTIGTARAALGDLVAARQALAEGLKLFVEAGDLTGIGLLLADIGVLAAVEGEHERGARLRGASLAAEERSGQGLVSNIDEYMPWDLEYRRGPLSQEEWDRLIEEGAAMPIEDAIALALKEPAR